MKTKKLSTYFGVFVASMMLFSACGGSKNSENITIESFMPADVAMILKFDYSDDSQKENLKTILANFPETGAKAMMIGAYNSGAPADLKYETAIQPILSGEWTFALGINFGEGFSPEQLESGNFENFNFVLAADFEKADELEELINRVQEEEGAADIEMKTEDDVKYWISEQDELFMARVDSIFVVTLSEEKLNQAVARAKNGEGAKMNEDLISHDSTNENALVSMYMNLPKFMESFGSFYDDLGLTEVTELSEAFGDAHFSISAEKDGFRMSAVSEYLGGNPAYDVYMDGYELSLAGKVPGQNLVMFAEEPNFGIGLEQALASFASLSTVDPTFPVVPNYDELLAQISGVTGVSEEGLDGIFNSPVAVVMDVPGVFPTFSFYVDLEESDVVAAEELMAGLDAVIAEMLVGVNQSLEIDFGPEAVKFEDMENGVRRVYFDGIPEEFFTELEDVFPEISTLKLEAYYGVNEDNLMFISFYPDFMNVYGESTVNDDEMYQNALASLGEGYDGVSVYFAIAPLADLVDKAVNISKGMGEVSDADYAVYQQVMSFIEPFKYMVGSLKIEDGIIVQENFVKIGE